jgi:predicted nucleic acid-binding Zn finger protein
MTIVHLERSKRYKKDYSFNVPKKVRERFFTTVSDKTYLTVEKHCFCSWFIPKTIIKHEKIYNISGTEMTIDQQSLTDYM